MIIVTTTRLTSVDPYPPHTPPLPTPPIPPCLPSPPHGFLSPANPVIHRCRQAISEDPGVRLQQIDKCANLSSDSPFAMLWFPENQIIDNFIFTPPALGWTQGVFL